MNEQATWRKTLIEEKIAPVYIANSDVAVILLVGSAGWGDLADAWSDIDLVMVWETMPDPARLHNLIECVGGVFSDEGDTSDSQTDISLFSWSEVYYLYGGRGAGIKIDVTHKTLASYEKLIADVTEKHDTHAIKLHAAYSLERCIAIHGDETLKTWQTRLSNFPAALTQCYIEQHLTLTRQWALKMLAERDDTLYLLQFLQKDMWTLMQVMLTLNHIYPPARPKHQQLLFSEMTIQPKGYAERCEKVLRLAPSPVDAVDAFITLTEDIFALIEKHKPPVNIQTEITTFRYHRAKWEASPFPLNTGQS